MGIIFKKDEDCIELVIDGALTIAEVDSVSKVLVSELKNAKRVKWAIAGITRCDTAGVQLVCSSVSYLYNHDIQSELSLIPDCVETAAMEIGIDLNKMFLNNEVIKNG